MDQPLHNRWLDTGMGRFGPAGAERLWLRFRPVLRPAPHFAPEYRWFPAGADPEEVAPCR